MYTRKAINKRIELIRSSPDIKDSVKQEFEKMFIEHEKNRRKFFWTGLVIPLSIVWGGIITAELTFNLLDKPYNYIVGIGMFVLVIAYAVYICKFSKIYK